MYVATIDWPITFTKMSGVDGSATSAKPAGEIEALNLNTGKVEWRALVPAMPLGAATVSNDLVFTTLYNTTSGSGELVALNRLTGAIAYQRKLPTTANSPIAITRNAVLVPAGGSRMNNFSSVSVSRHLPRGSLGVSVAPLDRHGSSVVTRP